MTPPRFQFTIANLLWFTFWVAAALHAWMLFPELKANLKECLRLQVSPHYEPVHSAVCMALTVGLVAPVMACLALFGRPRHLLWWVFGPFAFIYTVLLYLIPSTPGPWSQY